LSNAKRLSIMSTAARNRIVGAYHRTTCLASTCVAAIIFGNCLTYHDVLSVMNAVAWSVGTCHLAIALASTSVTVRGSCFPNT